MYIPNLQQSVPENSVKTKIKTETNNAWQPQHGAILRINLTWSIRSTQVDYTAATPRSSQCTVDEVIVLPANYTVLMLIRAHNSVYMLNGNVL